MTQASDAGAKVKLMLNNRQRNIYNCGIEDDHQLTDAKDDQYDPSSAAL